MPQHVPQKFSRGRTMLVMPPESTPAYNTSQIAYTLYPFQVDYYGKNQWIATPASMLQPLIMQTLLNTHYFNTVAMPPFVGRYDYVMTTQVIEFLQDFTCRPAIMRMRVYVQITSVARNKVIASKIFNVTSPLICKPPYGGVQAANRTTEKFLHQLAEFTLRNT